MRDDVYVTRLLVHDGRVFGAYGFDVDDGTRELILADAVILAAGGHTRIWRRSSSRRDENTGDAMRLAADAGCRLRDMELVQFHPTGMITPEESAGTLVTEAVRGEGGILRNADGERFMERYDPERLELSTRDRIALAELHGDRRGPRHRGGRRAARHHPPRPRDGARAPAAHVPPVRRPLDARHHPDADGGRADRALLDGRRVGRGRDPPDRRRGPLRGRGVRHRPARRQPPGRQLARRVHRLRQDRGRRGRALVGVARRPGARPRRDRRGRRRGLGAARPARRRASSRVRCSAPCAT